MTMALTFPSLRAGNLSGIALAAIAFALLTGTDTLFKLVIAGHPAYQIQSVAGFFSILLVVGRAAQKGGLKQLATTKPLLHIIRAAAGVLSGMSAIYAFARLPLTDFYAIVFAGPLVVTALSALWLGETVCKARWLAIGVGFCGVLVVVNPFQPHIVTDNSQLIIGRAAAFVSVFLYAVSVILVRRMRIGEACITFSFYGYLVSVLTGFTLMAFHGAPPLSLNETALLALAGALGAVGSLCLMESYYRASVATVAPFQYTQLFWGAVASYALWHIIPGPSLITGSAIVMASGLFLLHRDLRGTTG